MESETRQNIAKPFLWLIVVFGALVGIYSVINLSTEQLGLGYILLVIVTLSLGSRVIVQIPRCKGQISVSDTFVLLSLLLFGTEAAVLLAGADALMSSFYVSKKKLNIAFNTSVFLCSTFLTGIVLKSAFGSMPELTVQEFSPSFLLALTIMGLTQYAANSGLVATAVALRAGEKIWKMWHDNFLWTSLTYFAGAFAAGIVAKLSTTLGLFAFLATAPIIAIIYFTYCTYLKNIEAAAKQAELAETHVAQLNRHIAEQERISNALKESEEHFRTAFDHAVGMALVSPDNRWLEVNESLSLLLGYSQAELQNKSFRTIIHPDDLGHTLVKMQELLEGIIKSFQLEHRYINQEKEIIWVLSSASLVRGEDGKPKHMVFQVQNISDRKQAEEQIHYAAFHDALTGLPNRTLISDRMSIAVERAKKSSDYKFAILFIDLDRFKIVNDTMGHEMGDKLLINLSNRLKECIRPIDTVARLGGDEFAVLLDGITNQELAIEITTRIQESLSKPFDLDGQEFFTSASIGISFSSVGYERPEDILRDADTAMYRAKANGKARHEVFDLSMHTRAVEALKLENDLRQSIEKGELQPHFQPIVSLPSGTITGFEALARWEHPERGLISPVDFIPLAEETGLIVPLGMKILKDACQQLRRWQVMFNTTAPLTMSVNLSAKQFAQKDLVEEIRKVIRDAQIEADCIRLEITENIVMENAVSAIETLKQLKSIGVQLSIDDFGTGYSSLSYLHRFPFDILKIDRSFVSRMSTDKDSRSIVETITTLAYKLGKSTVAEGVETEAHKAMLSEFLCDYGQGYLFSKPLNSNDAEEYLRKNASSKNNDYQPVEAVSQNIETIANQYTM
ncbi:MAG: diguanylate cyclase/phosphodiesterase with sensor [Acidobacteria bacterium]|nr:diguanylate cyclase/phosphodiesterase with sensor [Acidobacteriota bacterium]